jgi:outer membrane murein-binding lipoprotein Lpp
MRVLPILALGLSTLFLAGCTETTRPDTAKADDLERAAAEYNARVDNPDDELICRREAKIGTRITEKVCRTRAQRERDAEEAETYLKKPRPTATQAF